MTGFITPILTETHGAWTFVYSQSPSPSASGHALVVEVMLGDVVKARIGAGSGARSEFQALDDLRARGLAWVADYDARPHAGDTGFASL